MIAFWFAVTALAVYRVARMIAEERGPLDLFTRFRNHFEVSPLWVYEGVRCTFCLSFWIAFLFCVPIAVTYQFSVFRYILSSLAVSGLVVMIHRYFG